MANTTSRSSHHHKALEAVLLFSLLLLMQRVCATDFRVGGSKGWTVPADSNAQTYNQWAGTNRFQVGDSLLFVYEPAKDSVLQVDKDGYTNCNTATYIATFNNGRTLFKFLHSGPHYFISGIQDNCNKNERMIVVVLADRSKQSSGSNQTSLESPPPSGSLEFVPSPTPPGEKSPSASPRSGASTMFLSTICSFGALVGSSLLLAL